MEIVISSVARTKKKFVTNVTGLARFGIKLADASRVFAKRFAAASSATPDKDEITIQGEVVETLAEFILKQWPVRHLIDLLTFVQLPSSLIWLSANSNFVLVFEMAGQGFEVYDFHY